MYERGNVATNITQKKHYKENYKQLYVSKLDNLDEMTKVPERLKQLKLTQEDIENLDYT